MKPSAAVLTGDLIGSTDASPAAVNHTMDMLATLAVQISATSFFTRYRGDGWQMYLADPAIGLSSVLYIFASLRAKAALESRIALGLGKEPEALTHDALASMRQPGDTLRQKSEPGDDVQRVIPNGQGALAHPGAAGLSHILGDAFTASGRALDYLEKSQRITIAGQGVDPLHRRLFSMIDERISSWSQEQSEAIALALHPRQALTQAEMASQLGVTRQAVAARLHAAGYRQLAAASQDFATTFGRGANHG